MCAHSQKKSKLNLQSNARIPACGVYVLNGMLEEALQMVEDGGTRVLENLSAAAIDPTHKEARFAQPAFEALLGSFAQEYNSNAS